MTSGPGAIFLILVQMNVGALRTTVVLILLIYGRERQSSVSETPQRYPLFLSLAWMATDSRQLGSHCLTLQVSRYSSPLTRARPFLPPQGSGRSTRSRGTPLTWQPERWSTQPRAARLSRQMSFRSRCTWSDTSTHFQSRTRRS